MCDQTELGGDAVNERTSGMSSYLEAARPIFFMRIDPSRQKREDLQLILFSVLLPTIMAGGTIWIMSNPGMRV